MLLTLALLATLDLAHAGPAAERAATVRATAHPSLTVTGLRASRTPVEVSSFTFQKIEWTLLCQAAGEPRDDLSCTVRSGSEVHQASSSNFIGETEKNLVVRVPARGDFAGFRVEIEGVNSGF